MDQFGLVYARYSCTMGEYNFTCFISLHWCLLSGGIHQGVQLQLLMQVCCVCDTSLFYAVLPDFCQVYGFIGSVFDPNTSGHLQTLKKMDPIDVETVYICSYVGFSSFQCLILKS